MTYHGRWLTVRCLNTLLEGRDKNKNEIEGDHSYKSSNNSRAGLSRTRGGTKPFHARYKTALWYVWEKYQLNFSSLFDKPFSRLFQIPIHLNFNVRGKLFCPQFSSLRTKATTYHCEGVCSFVVAWSKQPKSREQNEFCTCSALRNTYI
jgi:hypothetical protein